MKKILSVFLLLLTVAAFNPLMAQKKGAGFGVKAGMNYNTSGKYFKDAGNIWDDPGASSGYHFGGFYKFGNYDLFLRPELLFTNTKFDTGNDIAKISRLDAPVMVGLHMFEIFSVFGGPSFHYTLSDNYSSKIEGIDNNPLRFGYQFGLGLNIGPVGLDLRYEKEFNDQRINFDRIFRGTNDFKSEQVILGLSFQF
ncbi:outer membrane beta-barrel protein [Algoriphagus sediminis]|uniref:Outer membrane beta-barrel protein n=1 Tax=Algoriphagus sediminis TaxID=3057113 RepID=A0ABT7YH05_9BACT|nr:outer membrane beta-barrel protein [Algoriphagus sediminis]MDN3205793.1 outer membrane beta-barrel protein [Algoriphagus sediminis]